MKFVIVAVVLLAVAMGVQSSVIGLNGVGINGLGLGVNGLGAHGLGLGVNSLGLVNGLGLGGHGLGLGLGLGVNRLGLGLGVSGLGVAVGVPGQSLSQGLGVSGLGVSGLGVSGHGIAVGLPGQSLSQGPALLSGGLIGHGATYVAKTRGAIHTAPLAGHINSAASINLAPAPVYMIVSCLINSMIYAVPIIFIQSFLGQFSSTGFISVFRIAPLFKGLGFIGLAVNLTSLAFYSVFAAVPLLFLFHSLQPTLPWGCESDVYRILSNESEHYINHCTFNHTDLDNDSYIILQIPSVEFFAEQVTKSFSFPLFGCVLVIWVAVAFALYNSTERIGQILRYCCITLITLLVIVFMRMIFLPGVGEGFTSNVENRRRPPERWYLWILFTPLLTLATFGPGWGSVLTMASYNKFKTNISRYSWMISFSQLAVMLMVGLACMFTEFHLTKNNSQIIAPIFEMQWASFLSIPSSLATLEFPHMWTWMFLAVLIIGGVTLVMVQLFSVLTALLDEYVQLRPYRKELIFGVSGLLALVSALFCTEDGIFFIEILADLSMSSQCLLNFILLIVVFWVYGRERFQRDLEFMTSQVFATWKVYFIRFVTPFFLIFTLFVTAVLAIFSHSDYRHWMPFTALVALSPWLALPGYCVYRLMQTNGTFGLRFKRCTKPSDWYPVDAENRQRYEETIGNPETTHPLTTIVL